MLKHEGVTFACDAALDDETVDAYEQFCADTEYLFGMDDEMRARYPDCFVAVYHGEVVASGPTLEEVMHDVDHREVPRSAVAIDYITKEPRSLIL